MRNEKSSKWSHTIWTRGPMIIFAKVLFENATLAPSKCPCIVCSIFWVNYGGIYLSACRFLSKINNFEFRSTSFLWRLTIISLSGLSYLLVMFAASGYFKANVIWDSARSLDEISKSILLTSSFYFKNTAIESFVISLIIWLIPSERLSVLL